MRRNFLLFIAVLIGIILVFNSSKRLISFRSTAKQFSEAEERLEKLKKENEDLKRELEYKKSEEFTESEIRNKLGLVKEGETVVILPKDSVGQTSDSENRKGPNWEKWWDLFFGG